MQGGVSRIYSAVLHYCKKYGYLKALKKSLKLSESERFNKKKIDSVGLDVLDAVHCVVDKKRTDFFLKCIDAVVKKDDVVIEAGIGTGVLSFMSAAKGAQVYGIELNQKIFLLAKNILKTFYKKNIFAKNAIRFLKKDATQYIPIKKADVIISENIYTGMFYEKQIQIMNHLVTYLKKGGIVIPSKLVMGLTLVGAVFPDGEQKKDLFVVSEYKNGLLSQDFSQAIIYETLHFNKKNKLRVNKKIKLKIKKTGEANAVLLWNKVFLPDGNIIDRFDTVFLNNDIIIPLSEMKQVKRGDTITLHIRYTFGSLPKDALFKIV